MNPISGNQSSTKDTGGVSSANQRTNHNGRVYAQLPVGALAHISSLATLALLAVLATSAS